MQWLLDTDNFTARKICVSSDPAFQYSAMAAELVTGLVYLAIPLMLLALWCKRPNLLPSPSALFGFALFISACGVGHLLDVLVWEYPVYRVWIVSRWVTGVVSLAVLLMLYPIWRQVRKLRSSSEYHDIANKAQAAMNREALLRQKAERRAESVERELRLMAARIDHLQWRGDTAAEAEVLRQQLERLLKTNRAAG